MSTIYNPTGILTNNVLYRYIVVNVFLVRYIVVSVFSGPLYSRSCFMGAIHRCKFEILSCF